MPYGKVLVVDDVLTNLDVAKGMMLAYGLVIDCASSGKEAIQMIRDKKVIYDAVFMDHMMPEMDGIEAVRIIRGEIDGEYARTLPVIALTANALIGNDKLFLQNGFQDFLTKPIDMNKLDIILNKWVRNREKEQSPEWAPLSEKMRAGESAGAPEEAAPAAAVQPPSAGQSAPVPGSPSIPGIDFAAGVKRMANREDAYVRVLTSFAANMPALLDKIRTMKVDAVTDYTITIHGIKGACYGICADETGKQAEALEMAAKSGDYETIFAQNDDFILRLEKLIGDIKSFIALRQGG
jgi:CheY-like chemotaxis protein